MQSGPPRFRRAVASTAAAVLVAAALLIPATPAAAATTGCDSSTCTATFDYSGVRETFVVPAGVTSLRVAVQGAQGGQPGQGHWNTSTGGLGGAVRGVLPVTSGSALSVVVGQTGYLGGGGVSFGGGGATSSQSLLSSGGGGSFVLTTDGEIVAAAGGGGGAGLTYNLPQNGGAGAGATGTGGSGVAGAYNGESVAGGASSLSAGAGGRGPYGNGQAGSGPATAVQLNTGGAGAFNASSPTYTGGGGGGGYYGGGGGGYFQSGAGGAGFAAASMTSVVSETGVRAGHGSITFTWDLVTPVVTVSASPAAGSSLGDPVTFTASATGGFGTPAGSVRFEANGSPIAGCTDQVLANGSTQCATTALPSGAVSLRAVYLGSTTYATTASSAITYNVAYPAIEITTPTVLPNAVAGSPYTQQLTATGGSAPYSWIVLTGTLPAGLTLTASGVITGIPENPTLGVTNVTVQVNDSQPTVFVQEKSLALSVDAVAAFTSSASATFATGKDGFFAIRATGTPGATITHTSGILPAGLEFIPGATGSGAAVISGTPAAGTSGLYSVTLTATNGVGTPATQFLEIAVNQPLLITLDPQSAFVPAGSSATFSAEATGFPTPSVQWQVDSGSGAFIDIPGAASPTYEATDLTLDDSGHRYRAVFTQGDVTTTTASATLTVGTAPMITSTSAATFVAGQAGSVTVTGAGAPLPEFSADGTLPVWATLTNNGNGTATITGTPIAGGVVAFMLTASNGRAPDATQVFTLTVDSSPVITSADAASFPVGAEGAFSVTANAGYPVFATVDIVGSLPAGVTETGGLLSGTPEVGTGGQYPLTVTVSNAGSAPAAIQTLVLTVNESPTITSANETAFTVGSAATFTVTTAGGFPTDVALDLSSGSLPSGVVFVDNGDGTAALTGNPAVGGSGIYDFTITADNGIAAVATQSFTLTVNKAPVFTSLNLATFTAGAEGSAALAATPGFPIATTLSLAGDEPVWVTLSDEGNGIGTLSGTPPLDARGIFTFTVLASTSDGLQAAQSFTLTVTTSPMFSSAATATFDGGGTNTFTVTTGPGVPATTAIMLEGDLPAGVTFVDNGNGTATIDGIPEAGTGGTYPVALLATNRVTLPALQPFVLLVTEAASFTSAAKATFVTGIFRAFEVTTTGGFPSPAALTVDGSLPDGVTFTDNGNGTGAFVGMPAAGTVGMYEVRVLADNGARSASQNVLLRVVPSAPFGLPTTLPNSDGVLTGVPAITSPSQVLDVAGKGFSPGTTVTVGIYSVPRTLGTATVDSEGRFTATIVVPSDFDGAHTIVAVGAGADRQPRYLSAETTVITAESPVSALAATGSMLPISLLVEGAGLLMALGLALLIFLRTRRRATDGS